MEYTVWTMSLARKIFSNTAWQVIGKLLWAVLGVVSLKFVTNYLSPSVYGEYTIIYDYTALFAIVADFGLFTIAVREMAHVHDNKEKVSAILGNVLSIRTVLAIISLGIGALVAYVIPTYSGSQIPYGVLIIAAATVMALISGTMSSVLQFYLRMRWATVALTLGKIITVGYIALTVLVLYPNDPTAGFPHLLLAWIYGGSITLIITFWAANKLVPVRFRFDKLFWKDVLIKALPYGTALVLGTIYFRMGTISLSLFNMKEQAGFYGVPFRVLEILQIIPHYFMNSVLPVLTISLTVSRERSSRIVRYCINALTALGLPIIVGGFFLAWPITAAVSSPQFLSRRLADGTVLYGSDVALKLLLCAVMFMYLYVVLSYALVAMGRQKEILKVNAVAVTCNIILNFTLTPRMGFMGAALSALITELIIFVQLVYKIRPHLSNVWDSTFVLKTTFSSLCMGLFLWLTSDFVNSQLASKGLFVMIPAGAVVFGIVMLGTRAITSEMWGLLKSRGAKKDTGGVDGV